MKYSDNLLYNTISNNLFDKVEDKYAEHYRNRSCVKELEFKEEYQGRIIDCMIGEVDDNYIETPETDEPIVKLEHSREGLVKVPSIKGKTILVDEDGNETDTPREGCRLVSVGEEEDNKLIILSKNKNLLYGGFENGNLENNTANEFNQVGYARTVNYIQCKGNVYLKPSTSSPYRISQLFFYDKNKKFISRGNSLTPSNCAFVRLTIAKLDATVITESDLLLANSLTQLEEGTIITSFTEPKCHKTEILLDEPLREIDNKVFDEIVGNKIIRRVGRIVLNGSERWISWVNNSPTHNNCYVYINNTNSGLDLKASRNNMIRSDILEKKPIYSCSNKGIWFAYENYLAMGIPIEELDLKDTSSASNNTNAIKQWLSVNNVEVLYELAEPIIEELPNGITLQGYDDTTMYIENSITPTVTYGYNALIPYKEELSAQATEVKTNTLDIEHNIIPYLMDMEFNLMTMSE